MLFLLLRQIRQTLKTIKKLNCLAASRKQTLATNGFSLEPDITNYHLCSPNQLKDDIKVLQYLTFSS